MQATVSVVAMYVTVSSRNLIILSLTNTHFSKNRPENIFSKGGVLEKEGWVDLKKGGGYDPLTNYGLTLC